MFCMRQPEVCSMMELGVVIVTFNRLEKLKEALKAYEMQTRRPDRILVVDNCSTDGTDAYLQKWLNDKEQGNKKPVRKTILRLHKEHVVHRLERSFRQVQLLCLGQIGFAGINDESKRQSACHRRKYFAKLHCYCTRTVVVAVMPLQETV